MSLLAPQPAEKGAHQEFRIEAVGLRAPVFARHRDARGMDDISFDIAFPKPAREPEAVATSLIGNHDALDLTPGLAGFIAPTMQKLEQPFLLGIKLLQGMAFNPGNQRRYEPL